MNLLGVRWSRIHHSIVLRLIVWTMILVVVVNVARAQINQKFLAEETTIAATALQSDRSRDLAADIGYKVAMRESAVQGLSLALPVALLKQPAMLRKWLQLQHAVVSSLFDELLVEQDDGTQIAVYPLTAQPFELVAGGDENGVQIGSANGAPAVSVKSLLKRSDGYPRTWLRGVSKLKAPGFFDEQQTHKNGETGRNRVIFSEERLFFDLSNLAPRFQAMPQQKRQAPNELANLDGQDVIAAVSSVPKLAWVVAASMPLPEALSTIERRTRLFLNSVPLTLLAIVVLTTLIIFYHLRPLGRAARLADQMTLGQTPLIRLPVVRPDEIGALTAAFNRLLDRLDEQAKQLHAQKEMAEDAALAKSRFLAAASHDLRQPMHALNLYLGALNNFDLPDAARPAMASARECAQTMDEMFRALLDISKLDASSMQVNISAFAIGPLLEKIKNGFVQQARAKGLELRVVPCSAVVTCDPELLERVLANLVSNAVRYTEQGKVLIGCRRTTAGLRVGVYDTGPGIAADQQRAVFEEFYQVGNPERDRAQGLGLGLAIVQRLGALMAAPVALTSQLGKGSVFSIEVPRAKHPTATLCVAVPSLRGHHSTLNGSLIVVIDDEPQILDATALVLRQWGCDVVTATSGAEAIARLSLSERAPDVIVCDHRLRGTETGVDVIAALRVEFNLEIPALLITGDTSPQRIQSMAVTGIPVLSKPLQDHVLKDALLRLLNYLPMA